MSKPKKADFKISLNKIIEEFELEVLYTPAPPTEIFIKNNDINRPGLQFAGHYEYFDNTRIQIVGKAEMAFLALCSKEEKLSIFDKLLETKPPVIILARKIRPNRALMKMAKQHDVPVLSSIENTSVLISKIIAYLNLLLAPRITRHGTLIEVYGEGILILGESGVGKSETTIELVKRGHRLVADDAVEIRKTSNITLVGSSPDNIRHFMELRGIGIINARQLFGIGAVKPTEKINMVVELELWDAEKTYDRMGLDNNFLSILGVKVPRLVIPVKPGRNLAVILEVAAMNNREKRMGYNAAQDLMEQLGLSTESTTIVEEWKDG
jgi:HPr kinase/phosphorylase